MCGVISPGLLMLSVKMAGSFTLSIFQARSCEQASNWTLLLEENRSHVWSGHFSGQKLM